MEEPGIFGVRENSETATGKLFSHALLDCCMHVCGVSACVCVCVCVCVQLTLVNYTAFFL